MVEIIKEGKLKHELTCSYCGCVFTFHAEDVTKTTVWDDHGGHFPVCDNYSIGCPWCNKFLQLSESSFSKEEQTQMKHINN